MKTMSLKFNSYVQGVGVINNNIERLLLRIIFWSFGIILLLYILFLGNMVKNIIERKGLETRALSLSSEVQNLEVTYLSMSSGVDLAFSYSLGFKEAKATFATRKALGFNSLDSVKIAQNDL